MQEAPDLCNLSKRGVWDKVGILFSLLSERYQGDRNGYLCISLVQGNADLLLPPSAAALHVSVTTFLRLRLSLSTHSKGRQLSPNHAEYQRQSQK